VPNRSAAPGRGRRNGQSLPSSMDSLPLSKNRTGAARPARIFPDRGGISRKGWNLRIWEPGTSRVSGPGGRGPGDMIINANLRIVLTAVNAGAGGVVWAIG